VWRPCGFLQSATPATHLVETLPSLFRYQVPQWCQHLFRHNGQTGRQLDLHRHVHSPRRIPKGARQARHYYAGVGVGFDCRSFDPYVRGQGEYIMAEDLEFDSIVNTEIESIKSGTISY
jgi:hypothetical protein